MADAIHFGEHVVEKIAVIHSKLSNIVKNCQTLSNIVKNCQKLSAKGCNSCRSREMLQNESLTAKRLYGMGMIFEFISEGLV
jgi:hypothetical protein